MADARARPWAPAWERHSCDRDDSKFNFNFKTPSHSPSILMYIQEIGKINDEP